MEKTKAFFKGKGQLMTLVDRSLEYLGPESNDQPLKFLVNVEGLQEQFNNIPAFDESLRYYGNTLFLMGSRSRIYNLDAYQKVFPNVTQKDVFTLDAGHWVHFEKPVETVQAIS